MELSSEIEIAPAVVDADGWCEADLLTLLVDPSIFPVAIDPLFYLLDVRIRLITCPNARMSPLWGVPKLRGAS